MKNMLIAMTVALSIVGCSDVPECSDSDVEKLVIQITGDSLLKKYSTPRRGSKLEKEYIRIHGEEWYKSNMPHIKKVWAVVDSLELTAIRTDSSDEKLKKSTCKAQASTNNGNIIDISYSAQETSDGNLFVEVYGL